MAELLTTAQVAERLKVSVYTIQRWRTDGVGPPHVNTPGHPRYDAEVLQQWIEMKTAKPQEER